jgi:hypothetical protein
MWGELAPPRPPGTSVGGQAAGALEGDQGAAGPGAELAVRGHAQPVGGQPLLHGGTAWLRSPCCTASIPRRPAAGRVALPSSPGRHMEAIRTGARRLGASTIRPEPRYMPTLGQGEPHRHRRRGRLRPPLPDPGPSGDQRHDQSGQRQPPQRIGTPAGSGAQMAGRGAGMRQLSFSKGAARHRCQSRQG